jgi:hypothetical protein
VLIGVVPPVSWIALPIDYLSPSTATTTAATSARVIGLPSS